MNNDRELTGERLARIEERLKTQGKQLDDIDTKLDVFVLKADEKYAHQNEVMELKRGLFWLAGVLVTAAIGVIVHFIFFR